MSNNLKVDVLRNFRTETVLNILYQRVMEH